MQKALVIFFAGEKNLFMIFLWMGKNIFLRNVNQYVLRSLQSLNFTEINIVICEVKYEKFLQISFF